MKNELTIEQSQHLIELGVDAKLASKYCSAMKIGMGCRGIVRIPESKPIFELQDILAILPKEIKHKFDDGSSFTAQLFMEIYEGKWKVGYQESRKGATQTNLFEEKPRLNLYWVWLPELIDSLYKLLIWVITNGHYKPSK